ncbi:MAG: hypothetical protein HY074_10425 [Deltaproteobacteria bacterium]|nr:hypothetical protein [Deltaproteobacteria bacterium]
MIYFEVDGIGYAVDAAELAGVATGCPSVTYPGLPEGVQGLIQWSGKVFPVIDAFCGSAPSETPRPALDLRTCTYLFSVDSFKGQIKELAVAVPGSVRVFFAESTLPPPASASPTVVAMLIDQDGNEAYQLKLSKVAEQAARLIVQAPANRRGGRKVAA